MSRVMAKVRRARFGAGITFKMPKMFVPVDCQVPTTAKQLVARQLYQAGLISKADFEQMLGVLSVGDYDGDYDINNEEFDDEAFQTFREDYKQSDFADYEDFELSTAGESTRLRTDGTDETTSSSVEDRSKSGISDPQEGASGDKSEDRRDDKSM